MLGVMQALCAVHVQTKLAQQQYAVAFRKAVDASSNSDAASLVCSSQSKSPCRHHTGSADALARTPVVDAKLMIKQACIDDIQGALSYSTRGGAASAAD